MSTFLVVIIIILAIVIVIGSVVFLQMRRIFREQKNYERGLKFIPLLIHLPPPSDDTEVGGRDVRDVTEETVSRAQIIYNIIDSTFQKGFKQNFLYGQRHVAFEIVASQGFVYFYTAVPISLIDVVQQAIISAYPTARLQEVSEHNIFNPVGKIGGTLGGEFSLKESYAYPIATYQDLKRDAMQSLLNSLSGLGKEDGAAIQILLRPAHPSWRKVASSLASNKRKGDKKLDAGSLMKSLATAAIKAPEGGDSNSGNKKELSNLEQATLDAIDDKTRYAGYEVAIRVLVSSNLQQRSQAILSNIIASFSLYDAPGKNGFKYTPAKNVESLVTAYLMRFFPVDHKKNILNAVELATLFHFPDQHSIPTSQVVRQESKQVDGPRNIPEEGLLLGYNVFRGAKKPIRLSLADRQRHMYVVGQTGTGKSTYLENLALQDMLNGNGFAFVDPHGDVAERLLAMVPKERTEDLIYFSPADTDFPMGLNLFEHHNDDQKDFIIQEVLNMLQKLYDPQQSGIMGPRYEDMFRNAALVVMADPSGGTLIDIPQLFRDPAYLRQKLQYVTDQPVLDFWQKQFPAMQRSNEAGEVTAWFLSKFGAFLSNQMMRNIIGQTKSAFDLRDIMDNKKILLVNLSKGRTGDLNSKLLGMIFVMKFQAAAMSRADILEDDRVDFTLYVDEFQNFSTESFATIMSEARKYHLNLTVANQFTTQLTPEIRDAVFGNMGTIVSFRIGQNDLESLSKYFQPAFDGDDLLRVPNFNTIVRTLIGGVPTQPFSMATLPSLGTPNPKLGTALKQLSAAKYGRARDAVGQEITARLKTIEPARSGSLAAASPFAPPSPTNSPGPSAANSVARPSGPPPPGTGSFLDEWLSKRPSTPAGPAPLAAAAPNAALASSETLQQETQEVDEQIKQQLEAPTSPPAETADPATLYIDRDPKPSSS
ncbi:MAG TPA: ATP-binding protein [Candidatus Saccharimonadales bacterium]|nr:ATP-binding protein [Candidatus Saccharimonadales bacterium]